MNSQPLAELRAAVDRCLEGQEPAEVVAARIVALMADYYARHEEVPEAEPPLPRFLRAPRSPAERARLRSLCDALLEHLPGDHPLVEHLPVDDSQAAN